LASSKPFTVKALENSSLERQTLTSIAFKNEVAELRRQMMGANSKTNDYKNRLKYIKVAVKTYPSTDFSWLKDVKLLEDKLQSIEFEMWGKNYLAKRDIETLPGAGGRIETMVYQMWYSTSDPTTTQKEQYAIAKEEFKAIQTKVKDVKTGVEALEEKLNVKGIPYTPNRIDFREE
jgi:hypothetical protein